MRIKSSVRAGDCGCGCNLLGGLLNGVLGLVLGLVGTVLGGLHL